MSRLEDISVDSEICPPKSYETVLVIGSFDQFYAGQRHILKAAAKLARSRIIMAVSDVPANVLPNKQMTDHKFEELRRSILEGVGFAANYIRSLNFKLWVHAEPIIDPYCQSIYYESLDAILASKETLAQALSINKKRREKGLSQLIIEVVESVTEGSGEDGGAKSH